MERCERLSLVCRFPGYRDLLVPLHVEQMLKTFVEVDCLTAVRALGRDLLRVVLEQYSRVRKRGAWLRQAYLAAIKVLR